MDRWSRLAPPQGIPMSAVAADPAAGGVDDTVLSARYDYWFDKLVVVPGKNTPEGKDVAALIFKERKDGAEVTVDMGGGYGGAVKMCLEDNGIKINTYKGAVASTRRDRAGQLGFYNTRSEVWWLFREALDPSQPGGSQICLPNNQKLLSQLTAPEVDFVRHNQILCVKVEPKDDVKARLGQSPGEAEAVVMCWWKGPRGVTPQHPGRTYQGQRRGTTKVNLGYANRKRTRR